MILYKKEVRNNTMKKTDIMQENLCIQKIITVIQGKNPNHHKLLTVKSRHSDAFVYVISGSCTYRFDDKTEFKVTAGDVFYLPYQSIYTMYIHTDDYKFIFCDFEFAEPSARRSALYSHQDLKNVDSLFFKLLNRYRSSANNSYIECMSILYSIYGLLQQNTQKSYIGKSKERNMIEARCYIDENFNLPEFSISQIAEKIKRMENEHINLKGRKIRGIADPAISKAETGESIADMFASQGVFFDYGDNERLAGKMQFHYRFAFDDEGIPMMYVFDNC